MKEPLDLEPLINHSVAPIWYSAAVGTEGEKREPRPMTCPVCGVTGVRIQVDESYVVSNEDGLSELPVRAYSKIKLVDEKSNNYYGICIPMVCFQGHEFDLSIEQRLDEEVIANATIEVTLADDSYLKKYPAEYERWG